MSLFRLPVWSYWTGALVWAGVIFVLSHQSTLPHPPSIGASISAGLGHITVYFVLAALITLGLLRSGVESRRAVGLAITIAVLYGISDEWHQSYVPGRHPSVEDVLLDLLGATLGAMLVRWRWTKQIDQPIENQDPA